MPSACCFNGHWEENVGPYYYLILLLLLCNFIIIVIIFDPCKNYGRKNRDIENAEKGKERNLYLYSVPL